MRHRREDLSNSGNDRNWRGNSCRERNIFHEQHCQCGRSLDLNIHNDGNNTDGDNDGNNTDRQSERSVGTSEVRFLGTSQPKISVRTSLVMSVRTNQHDRSVGTSQVRYVGTSSPERSFGTCHAKSLGTNQQERSMGTGQPERPFYKDLRRPKHDGFDNNYRHEYVWPSRFESVPVSGPTAEYNTYRNSSSVSYPASSPDYVHLKDTNPSIWPERGNEAGSRFRFPQQEQLLRRDISQCQNRLRLMASSCILAKNYIKPNPVVASVTVSDVGQTEKWPPILPDVTDHHTVSVCRPDETFKPVQLTGAVSYLGAGSNKDERKDVPLSFPNISSSPPRKYSFGLLAPKCPPPLLACRKPVPQLRQLPIHLASRHPAQKQPPQMVFHHPAPQQPQLTQPPLHLQEVLQLPNLLPTFMQLHQPYHPAPPQSHSGPPQPCHPPPPMTSRIPPVYVFETQKTSDFQTTPIDPSRDQELSSICKPNYLDDTKSVLNTEQKTQKVIIPLEGLHKQDRKPFQQGKDETESYSNSQQILGNQVSNDHTRDNCAETGHVDTKGRRTDVSNTDQLSSLAPFVKIFDSENIGHEDNDFSDEQKEKIKSVKQEKEIVMKDCDTLESKTEKYEHKNKLKHCKKTKSGTFNDQKASEVTGKMVKIKTMCASDIVHNGIPNKKLNNVQVCQPCLVDCDEMRPSFHQINTKCADEFVTYGRRIDKFNREIFDQCSEEGQITRKAYYIHRPWEAGTFKIPRVVKRNATEVSKEKVRVGKKPHKRKIMNDNLRKTHVSRKDKYEISKSEIHAEKRSVKSRKRKFEICSSEKDIEKGSGKKHSKTEKDELNKTFRSKTEATCKETAQLKYLHPKFRHKRNKACLETKAVKKINMSDKVAMTVSAVGKMCTRNNAHIKEIENVYEPLKKMPCYLTRGKFCLSAPNTYAANDLKRLQDRDKEKSNNNAVEGNEMLDKALGSAKKHLLYRAHAINDLTRNKIKPLIVKKSCTRKLCIATNMAKQELGILEESCATETEQSVFNLKESKDQTLETNKTDIGDENFNVDCKCEKNVLALDMPSTIYQPHIINVGSFATQCLLGPVVSSTYYRAPEKSRVIRNAKESFVGYSKSSIDMCLTETAKEQINMKVYSNTSNSSEQTDCAQTYVNSPLIDVSCAQTFASSPLIDVVSLSCSGSPSDAAIYPTSELSTQSVDSLKETVNKMLHPDEIQGLHQENECFDLDNNCYACKSLKFEIDKQMLCKNTGLGNCKCNTCMQISETNENVQEQLVTSGEFLNSNISDAEEEELQIPISCNEHCIHPSVHQLEMHRTYLHTKQEISASLDDVESDSCPIPVLPVLLQPIPISSVDVSSVIDTQNYSVPEGSSLHVSATSYWNRADSCAPELSNFAQPVTLDLMNSAQQQVVPGLSNPTQLFDPPDLSNSTHTAPELSYPTYPTSGIKPNAQHLSDVENQQSRFESESDKNLCDSTDNVNINSDIYDPSKEDLEMSRDSQIQRMMTYSDVKSQGSPYCRMYDFVKWNAGYDNPECRKHSHDTKTINRCPRGREQYDTDGEYLTSGAVPDSAVLCPLAANVDENQLFEDEESHIQCDLDAVDRNVFEIKLGNNLSHVDGELKGASKNMFEDFVCDLLKDEEIIYSVPIAGPDITNELDCDIKLEQTHTINNTDNGFKSARTPLHLRTCRKPRFEKRFPKPLPRAKPQKLLCAEMELYKAAERFLGDFDCSHKRSCKAKYELLVNPVSGKMESVKAEKEKIEWHIKKDVKHENIEDQGIGESDVKDDWAALDKPCVEEDTCLIKTSKDDGEIQSKKDLKIITRQQIAMKNFILKSKENYNKKRIGSSKNNLNKSRNISTSGKIRTLSIESVNRMPSIKMRTVKHLKSENNRLLKLWHITIGAGKNIKNTEHAKFNTVGNQSLEVTKDMHDKVDTKSKIKVETRTNREVYTKSRKVNGCQQSKTSKFGQAKLIKSHPQACSLQSNTSDAEKCHYHEFCGETRKERKTSSAKKQSCKESSYGSRTCEVVKQKHTKSCKETFSQQSKACDANKKKRTKSCKETGSQQSKASDGNKQKHSTSCKETCSQQSKACDINKEKRTKSCTENGSQQSKTSDANKNNKQKSREEVGTQNMTSKMKQKHAQSCQEAGSLQSKTTDIWQEQYTKSDMEADNKKATISGINHIKHVCQVCSFTCNHKTDLKLHYNCQHSNWCLRCAKEFKDQGACRTHMNHNHDIALCCQLCGTTFMYRSTYERHLRSTYHQENAKLAKVMKKLTQKSSIGRNVSEAVMISDDDDSCVEVVESTNNVLETNEPVYYDKKKICPRKNVTKNVNMNVPEFTALNRRKRKIEDTKVINITEDEVKTDRLQFCKVCRKYYKIMRAHLKTIRHQDLLREQQQHGKECVPKQMDDTVTMEVLNIGKCMHTDENILHGNRDEVESMSPSYCQSVAVVSEQDSSFQCESNLSDVTKDTVYGNLSDETRYTVYEEEGITVTRVGTGLHTELYSTNCVPVQHNSIPDRESYSTRDHESYSTSDLGITGEELENIKESSVSGNDSIGNAELKGETINTYIDSKTTALPVVVSTCETQTCSPILLVRNIAADLMCKKEPYGNTHNIFEKHSVCVSKLDVKNSITFASQDVATSSSVLTDNKDDLDNNEIDMDIDEVVNSASGKFPQFSSRV